MANQIQATVYQIDGSPLNNSIQIAFLTSNVYMREFQTDLIPEVNSAIVYYPNTSNQLQEQTFLVSETIADLVTASNANGTKQISATVLEINQEPQISSGIVFSFPVQGISIWPATNPVVDGVNSFIEFKNKKYYLLEDEDTLVTAANSGGSGNTPTLNDVLSAGNNSSIPIAIGDLTLNFTQIDTSGLTVFLSADNAYYTTEYLPKGIEVENTYGYKTKLLIPIEAGSGISKDITNYLPENSGTLLNGKFVNGKGLEMFTDPDNDYYLLGQSGKGLSVDNFNDIFSLGNYAASKGLIINDTNQEYYFGDQINTKGVFINLNSNAFGIGDFQNTNIQIDSTNDSISFSADNFNFYGSITASSATQPIPPIFLKVKINGTDYKINLLV